jgi:hypothetical protein
MRLGTQADLSVVLQGMGFGGAAKHGFYRAGESDHSPWDRCAGSSHLGNGAAVPTSVTTPGVVARLLSFCAPSPITASGARAATRTRGQASGTTLPAPDAGYGCRQNHPTMDDPRGARLPLAAGLRLKAPKPVTGARLCRRESAIRSTRMEPPRGREGPSGLPHHQKPARNGFGKVWSMYPPCLMAAPVASFRQGYVPKSLHLHLTKANRSV